MKHLFASTLIASSLLTSTLALAAEKTVTLAVENMYCASCPFIVNQSLGKVMGVSDVSVSYEDKTAKVTFDDAKTTIKVLTDATFNAGYPSSLLN